MNPIHFDVVRPHELGEALAVLSRFGGDARVLVGGSAAVLVFIRAIARRTTGCSLTELSRRRSGLT